MYDVLQELSDLSESLQAESINLPKAHRLIVRQVDSMLQSKQRCGVKNYKKGVKRYFYLKLLVETK